MAAFNKTKASGSRGVIHIMVTAIFGMVVVALLSVFSMWLTARHQRAKFEELGRRCSTLKANTTNFEVAKQILNAYSQHATIEGQTCTGLRCKFIIVLTNFLVDRDPNNAGSGRWFDIKLLRHVGIRPAVAVAKVSVESGRVQTGEFVAAYESTRGAWIWASWNSVVQLSQALKCANLAQGRERAYAFSVGYTNQPNMDGPYVSAFFEPAVDESERERCQYIKFDCMTSFSECSKDQSLGARPLMPRIDQELVQNDSIRQSHSEQYENAVRECLYAPEKPTGR
jgi:hypothetical protein